MTSFDALEAIQLNKETVSLRIRPAAGGDARDVLLRRAYVARDPTSAFRDRVRLRQPAPTSFCAFARTAAKLSRGGLRSPSLDGSASAVEKVREGVGTSMCGASHAYEQSVLRSEA
eukprot:6198796-Pleurochrysis_carterae.AAC.2